jgi:hypothetical protein
MRNHYALMRRVLGALRSVNTRCLHAVQHAERLMQNVLQYESVAPCINVSLSSTMLNSTMRK